MFKNSLLFSHAKNLIFQSSIFFNYAILYISVSFKLRGTITTTTAEFLRLKTGGIVSHEIFVMSSDFEGNYFRLHSVIPAKKQYQVSLT